MFNLKYLAIAIAATYALEWYGRRAAFGQAAGADGDAAAEDLARGLTFTEAAIAGARSLAGKPPIARYYVVN